MNLFYLHILRTDFELLRICEPKKTVFILDRGKVFDDDFVNYGAMSKYLLFSIY